MARLDCASANIKLFQVFLCYLQKNIKDGFVKVLMLILCSSPLFGLFFVTANFTVLPASATVDFLTTLVSAPMDLSFA